MKRLLTIMLSVFIIAAGFIALRFGSALSQEGNPVPILISITKLEFTNSDYEQFSDSDKEIRFVSENIGESRYFVVKEFMKKKGWDYKDQMGSGLIFEKDMKTLIVETRQFSRHYFLWDIPKQGFETLNVSLDSVLAALNEVGIQYAERNESLSAYDFQREGAERYLYKLELGKMTVYYFNSIEQRREVQRDPFPTAGAVPPNGSYGMGKVLVFYYDGDNIMAEKLTNAFEKLGAEEGIHLD